MKRISVIAIFLLLMLLESCAHINGDSFLKQGRYDEGIRTFDAILKKDPNNPVANYYMGRFYLAQEKPEIALTYLRRAVRFYPKSPKYYFWLGVAYWAVKDFEKERVCYLRALTLDKRYVPARLYLGHNYLDNGRWEAALREYNIVLKYDPYNPEALYNRGLALGKLKRKKEEIKAWKRYLKYYPRGKWALRAVDHLNALGDFSYRNFVIGYRRVTLKSIRFQPGTSILLSESLPSLDVLGSMLTINKRIILIAKVYKSKNLFLAKKRAKKIKDYLLDKFSKISSSRIKLEAYGHSERIKKGRRFFILKESVAFSSMISK